MPYDGAMHVDQFTADSSVLEVSYAHGEARLVWEDYEIDGRYELSVKTTTLLSEGAQESGSVHIRFEELAKTLPIDGDSGRYCPPSNFGAQMKARRNGHHLAVGLRASEYPYLFVARGYKILLAVPVGSPDDVRCTAIT